MKVIFPKLNNNQALLIQLCLILILVPILILNITHLRDSFFFINSLKYINCFVFAWIFFSTLWIGKKNYHPYSLFLISFFTFLISRVFFDVFSSNPKYNLERYNAFDMEGAYALGTQVKLQLLLLISMLFGNLGALVAFKNTDRFEKNRVWKYDEKWGKIGLFLFWIFLVPAFIYYAEQVYYLLEVGYKNVLATKVSLFTSSSLIFRLSDDLFYLGFILFIAAKPSWKKLLIPLIIFIFILLFRSILGARVVIFTQMLMLVTYLGYRKFIKTKYVLLVGVFLIMISAIVANFRTYSYYEVSDKFKLEEAVNSSFISDFFKSQNITLEIASMALEQESKGKITKEVYPFLYPIFQPFISFYAFMIGHEEIVSEIDNECYLANKLSVVIIGEQLVVEEGLGLGSSYILEFYFAFGLIGCATGCFLLFYFLFSLIGKYITNTFYSVFILLCIPSFFYMPRAHPLNMIGNLIKPMILLLVVVLVVELLRNFQSKTKRY